MGFYETEPGKKVKHRMAMFAKNKYEIPNQDAINKNIEAVRKKQRR